MGHRLGHPVRVNIAAKIVLDLIGVAAGGNGSAVGKSLMLTFGLTLLGEAIVIGMRANGTTRSVNPRRSVAAESHPTRTPRSSASPTSPASSRADVDPAARTINQPAEHPVTGSAANGGIVAAIQAHHARHEDRHDRRHQHRHGRDGS